MELSKAVYSLVLDAGPILKNEPSISSLRAQSEMIFTVPSVIDEIRDASARSRIETTLLPFMTLRSPAPQSLKLVADFSRKTGDFELLSRTDLQVLALAYELECERNGGDWRLRRVPGQKALNGPLPAKQALVEAKGAQPPAIETSDTTRQADAPKAQQVLTQSPAIEPDEQEIVEATAPGKLSQVTIEDLNLTEENWARAPDARGDSNSDVREQEDSDSDGWITPSNIKKQKSKDDNASLAPVHMAKPMQVATLTTDFAMQNVLLQMNLNLLSSSLMRVRHLKTFVLRCHACFQITKEMGKQFCPRCGKPTLLRASCSTTENGEFKVHLKRNMQWNTRGDRYSIPKPINGSSSGKTNVGGGGKGGGKGGWGQGLILAEDQKEYVRAMEGNTRKKQRDLMDEDYLPSIMTGDRNTGGGRPKVGAGRNVNSRKRG